MNTKFLIVVWITIFLFKSALGGYVKYSSERNVQINYLKNGKTSTEQFVVFQNSDNDNLWYYLPKAPRLYEKIINGKGSPELLLVKYSLPSKNNIGKQQGGSLQFSVSNESSPEATAALLKKLQADEQNPFLQIAPISSTDATVSIYLPVGNSSLDSLVRLNYGLNTNLFPLYSTQKASFTIPLTDDAVNILLPILQKGKDGGIEISTQYTIAGRVEATINATIDWKKTYNFLKTNETIRAEVGFLGFFGASYEKNIQHIKQSLIESGSINVDIKGSEITDSKELYKYWEPIANLITAKLFKPFEPPTGINNSGGGGLSDFIKNSLNQASSFKVSGSYGFSMVDLESYEKGSYPINMKFSDILKRKVPSDGFVSLNDYDPKTINDKILIIDESQFKKTFFNLPSLPSEYLVNNSDLVKVDMTISLNNDAHPQARHLLWEKGQTSGYWKIISEDGQTKTDCSYLIFNSYESSEEINVQLDYKSNEIIVTKNFKLNVSNDVITNISDMKIPLGSLMFEDLNFNKLVSTSDLRRVYINKISNYNKNIIITPLRIEPKIINGTAQPVAPYYFILDDNSKPLFCEIQFDFVGGSRKNWKYNNLDLSKYDETKNYQINLVKPD